MDGFKNTTRTQYDTASGRKFANGGMTVSRNDMAGGEGPMSKPAMVAKYAKGGSVKKGEQKIGRVMKEFTEGKLHSGSKEGPKVKSTKQAVAIALNEARAAGAKIPRVKKAFGGEVDDVLMARMTKEELAQGAKGIRMARERLDKQSVKRGVPPANRKPMISERMEDVGRSIGVVKKAAGGMTLSNVPQSKNSMPSGVGTMRPSKTSGATAPTLGKTPSGVGTERPSKTSMAVAPGRGMTLGMNKGGVAKKAAGGMTLSNAPTRLTMSNATSSAPAPKVSPAVSAPTKASAAPAPSKMSAAAAPSRGLTLSGPNVGRRLTLGMNKGGLSVMPRGKKGC
jgi:hypothetical protein